MFTKIDKSILTWKAIPGYVDKYEVSNFGDVRSLNYSHTGKTQLLKQGKGSNGNI